MSDQRQPLTLPASRRPISLDEVVRLLTEHNPILAMRRRLDEKSPLLPIALPPREATR